MKGIDLSDVRSFALLGHTASGKTSLLDAILYHLKETERLGSTAEKTSAADYTEEEQEHQMTIWPKSFDVTYNTHAGHKSEMVIVDSPGYAEFYGGVIAATRATDAALVVVDAAAGIQVGTLRAWRRCHDRNLPRGVVITGLDKDNTDYETTVADIIERWGSRCIPVVIPTSDRQGVVSILETQNIPDDLKDTVESLKNQLLEAVAETDDSLIEKYLGGEEISKEEFAKGLHAAVNSRAIIPVFVALPLQGIGIEELLESIHHSFPTPVYHDVVDLEGNVVPSGKDAPFSGIVWKTVNDPFIGHVSFIRIMTGTLNADSEIYNPTKDEKERIGQLLVVNGRTQQQIKEAHAGDIIAVARLKVTSTNDSLCAMGSNIRYEPLHFPEPVMPCAVHVENRGEEDKLATALARATEEDPTLRIDRNKETHELILSGLGDLHLGVTVEHIQHRSGINLKLDIPKVAYKETITSTAEGHHRHKKQSGGRGQFGEVYLRVSPRPEGQEEWFFNEIHGGSIPSNFLPAVEKGLVEGMVKGVLAGYPIINVEAHVYDGSYHAVDSSEQAFKMAASRALHKGLEGARSVLLEPIMELKIMTPGQFLGDITGDLSQRRGRIMGMAEEDGMQIITAEAPQSEIFRYASDLRGLTGGHSSFELTFARYEQVPGDITKRVVDAVKAAREAE